MPRVNINSIKWRSGAQNPAGNRPFVQRTKTYKFTTASSFESAAWTSGYANVHYFPVTCLNDPLGQTATTIGFTAGDSGYGTGARPQFHDIAINDGYKVYEVLSATYDLDVTCKTGDNNNVIVAWCFQPSQDDGSGVSVVPIFDIPTTAIDSMADTDILFSKIRLNGGWAFAKFSGVSSGGSPYSTQGTIRIPIPSVRKLGMALWAPFTDSTGTVQNAITNSPQSMFKGVLQNATSAAAGELGRYHLCVYCFKEGPEDSTLMLADEIKINVTINQKAKLWRDLYGDGTEATVGAVAGTLFDAPGVV